MGCAVHLVIDLNVSGFQVKANENLLNMYKLYSLYYLMHKERTF